MSGLVNRPGGEPAQGADPHASVARRPPGLASPPWNLAPLAALLVAAIRLGGGVSQEPRSLATATLPGNVGVLRSAALAHDGSRLALAGSVGGVTVQDVATGREPTAPGGDDPAPAYCLAFAPDGATLAAGGVDAT